MSQKLIKAIPDYAFDLFNMGLIRLNICSSGGPPTLGWTEWHADSKSFEINIAEKAVDDLSIECLGALIEHELNHISGGHFNIKCNGVDRLISTDIEANWWLQGPKLELLRDAVHQVINPLVDPIDPVIELKQLGLNEKQCYRASILHDMMHVEGDEDECGGNGEAKPGMCGGISKIDDPRAKAIGSLVSIIDPTKDDSLSGMGVLGGNGEFKYQAKDTPKWAKKMQEWARAIVEPCLSEGRKHSRPVWSMREAGLHVPSLKPRWDYKPKMAIVCLDTSGSMWGIVLNQTASAVNFLRQHNIQVRLIAGDTSVQMDEELTNGFPKNLPGGGGTDIVPLYDHAVDKYNPEAIIFITDGYVPRWPKNKKVDILWITLPDAKPPFGTVVFYED